MRRIRLKKINSFVYDDIKSKYNYTMYVYYVMSDSKFQTTSCADRMFNIRWRRFGCRLFDIRWTADRMSNTRRSTDGRSNVE